MADAKTVEIETKGSGRKRRNKPGAGALKGNQNRTTHGGDGAIQAISAGRPLTGLAHEAVMAVVDELQRSGIPPLIERNAVRLQAATDLFWNAVQKAADDGDLVALDRYATRFGWLATKALAAWRQVEQSAVERGLSTADILEAYRDE